MKLPALAQGTLELIKYIRENPASPLAKAWTQAGSATSGITAYDLEAPAKKLFPVITPLRNEIPRVSGKGGIQANWRAVTGINTTGVSAGVSQGNRGGVITTTTKDYTAAYVTVGLEDYVTWQADFAAEYFEDLKSLAQLDLLQALMIAEEKMIIGGNGAAGVALGTTPTPSLTGSSSGGSLGTMTLSVICVALAYNGWQNSTVAGGVPGQITRTNADASVDTYGGGSGQKSANATASITGPTGSCQASVAQVPGAVAYAWFWGTAGSETLGAITTINSVVIKATATGTQLASALPAADNSQNTLEFSGMLYQMYANGSNSQVSHQATGTPGTGTPLTADGQGGIVEIDADLQAFWDNYRLSPTEILVNSQEQKNISAKILQGGSNTAQRFVLSTNEQGMLAGGYLVRSYLNKFSMDGAKEIPIKLHPNVPPGLILYRTSKLPYPLSNVTNVLQIRTRLEYRAIEWPMTSPKYPYGIYADEVLQNFFPPAFGVRDNIANG